MDTGWLFSSKYDKLNALINSSDVRDYLDISVWLRAFLLDGELTGEEANRQYGIIIKFHILPFVGYREIGGSTNSLQLSDAFLSASNGGGSRLSVSRDVFLGTQVLRYAGLEFTVADIVRAAANVAGGVHSKPDPKNTYLIGVSNYLFNADRAAGLVVTQAIARHVIAAYSQLRAQFAGIVGTLRQEDASKQPKLVGKSVEFMFGAFMEDGLDGKFTDHLLAGMRIAFRPSTESEEFIFDMGSMLRGRERLSLKTENGLLIATFKGKVDGLSASMPLPATGVFATVMVRVVMHFTVQTSLSLSIDRQQTHEFGDGIEFCGLKGKRTFGANLSGKQSANFQLTEYLEAVNVKSKDDYNLREYLIRRNRIETPSWQTSAP